VAREVNLDWATDPVYFGCVPERDCDASDTAKDFSLEVGDAQISAAVIGMSFSSTEFS